MLSRNIVQVRVISSFFHTVRWFHEFFYSPKGTTLFKVKKNCLISKVLNPWGPGEAVQGKNSYFSFENSSLLVWRIFKTSFNIVKMTEFMLKTDTTTSLGVQEPEVAFSETIWEKREKLREINDLIVNWRFSWNYLEAVNNFFNSWDFTVKMILGSQRFGIIIFVTFSVFESLLDSFINDVLMFSMDSSQNDWSSCKKIREILGRL